MSAYLRSWLGGSSSTSSQPQQQHNTQSRGSAAEISLSVPEPKEGEDDDDAGDADSDVTEKDAPPAFPAVNSAQRLGSSTKTTVLPNVLTDPSLMPPPPSPSDALRVPGAFPTTSVASSSLSPGASLRLPPSSTNNFGHSLGVNGSGGGGGMLGVPATTNIVKTGKKAREKVALKPGFGPLDWAALKSSGTDLRGVDTLLRVTPSMLKQHNKKNDAWSAFYGKVYNITPYLPYHPGGEKELMRVAGRDGTKLFVSTHAWVNVEFMLDSCLVGFLVSEVYGS